MVRQKVVIQYPFIPLYRVPIFTRLSLSEKYDYVFWSGLASPDKYLKTTYDTSFLKIVEVPLRTLRVPLIGREFELQLSAVWQLIKSRPDIYIILGNPNSLSSWLCMIVARARGSVVLSWSHGFLSNETGVKGWIRTRYYRLAHGHLLYGKRAKNIMAAKGFPDDCLHVIYNSLDYQTQRRFRDRNGIEDRLETRRRYNIPHDAIVLIAIGRLMPKLKLHQVVEGLRLLQDTGKTVFLFIVGDGPERANLLQKARSHHVENRVIFYGACHNEQELSLLFNAADISVVMGKVGLAAMHALAYGVPVLTNSNFEEHFPEIEAVIEGETGWYFREDDIHDFVNNVRPVEYKGTYYDNCIRMIERYYTPERQFALIERAIGKYATA